MRLMAAGAALAVLGSACSSGDDGAARPGGDGADDVRPNLQLASSLRQLGSCEDLQTWMRDELAPRVGAYGYPGGGGVVP
ncbi:MAG: hypothetical protein ACRDOX_13030, partial [Nocardioides sp.]